MAVFGVTITKQVAYRGGIQPFSNVYHFKAGLTEPFDDQVVFTNLVAAEKAIHSSSVTFVQARSWGPTDGPASASVTRAIKDLTGVGSLAPSTDQSPEMCILLKWPLGRYGLRNRPQFLRKWIHPVSIAGTTTTQRAQAAKLTNPMEPFTTFITTVTNLNGPAAVVYKLCTKDGREPTSGGGVYDWVEHHQLGEQWR